MTIVVLQLKLQLQRIDIFLQPHQWGIPELQLQQLLRRRCNDQVSSGGRRVDDGSPNRFPSSGFRLGQLVFFLPANKADSHNYTRRSTPRGDHTTCVSRKRQPEAAQFFSSVLYLKVNTTTGTIYIRGFLVAFHFFA